MFAPLHRPVALRAAPMGIQLEPAGIMILLLSIIIMYCFFSLFIFLLVVVCALIH